jgi:hypothetical protein
MLIRVPACDIVRRVFPYHLRLFATRETNNTMTTASDTVLPRPFTLNDINVGSKLYAALVRHAATHPGRSIFYGDLLDQARKLFPEDAEVKRAVPIGIGMKLLFVEAFCNENGYPNLACLAVNKTDKRPGGGFPGNWEQQMREVADFDWSKAQPTLDAYVTRSISAVTPLRRRKETEARELLFAHFREHRSVYRDFTHDDREEMVSLLMEGFDSDTALRSLQEAKLATE